MLCWVNRELLRCKGFTVWWQGQAPAQVLSPPSFGFDDRQNLAGPSGGNGLIDTETLAAGRTVRLAEHVGQLRGDVGMAIGNRASMQTSSDTR